VHFSEKLDVPVSVAEAWDFIWQVERVAACLPGCIGVDEKVAQKSYIAHFQDHVGPYKVAFDLDVEIKDVQPPQSIKLSANGKDPKLGVAQKVDLDVSLREAGPQNTVLDVEADVEVLGKVATLGQFVVKRKAAEIVKQFTRNIAAELQPRATEGQRA
jgi:carbon monoxide dehydrogenase subunit G